MQSSTSLCDDDSIAAQSPWTEGEIFWGQDRLDFFATPSAARRVSAESLLICAPPTASVPMPQTNARQVLYVEDDRINIVLMEEVFRRLPDWQLECAEDGAQALQLLESLRPDLVLIDMNLPDMSGLALLERLRSDARLSGLNCVALSADDRPDQMAAARAAGFSDYWVKPIDVLRLTEALQASVRP